jgi:glutathione S-transferase
MLAGTRALQLALERWSTRVCAGEEPSAPKAGVVWGMALTLFAGSGSPPTWRVWLTLEHKAVPYELKMLSFQDGDVRKPDFLALNPRGKVPTLVDDGFAIGESGAICEYLEERFPERPLLPTDVRERAVVRRLCAEAQLYAGEYGDAYFDLTLFGGSTGTREEIARARERFAAELARWETIIAGDHVAGALSMADFALYPTVAMVRRLEARKPELEAGTLVGPRLGAWMKRIEALPYYDRTYPPHWRP